MSGGPRPPAYAQCRRTIEASCCDTAARQPCSIASPMPWRLGFHRCASVAAIDSGPAAAFTGRPAPARLLAATKSAHTEDPPTSYKAKRRSRGAVRFRHEPAFISDGGSCALRVSWLGPESRPVPQLAAGSSATVQGNSKSRWLRAPASPISSANPPAISRVFGLYGDKCRANPQPFVFVVCLGG